jgi:hypothetical protein
MRRTALALLATLLIPSSLLATSRRPDGEYWRALEPSERAELAQGIFIGIFMGSSYGDLSTENALKLTLKSSNEEAVAKLDAFYEDPLNRPIWIESAWIVAAARVHGRPEEEIAKIVAELRAAVAGKASQPPKPLPTKHPEVYEIALEFAGKSKTLAAAFGESIEFFNEQANAWALGPDQGEAYVSMQVKGSKATGRLNGHAKRSGGIWVYDSLEVLVVETADTVDLLTDTRD